MSRSKPFVSVVMPTMRVGGLDVVIEGLRRQSYRDFELVIADGLYKHRTGVVADVARTVNFQITHVEPFDNPFPLNSFCRYSNTALAHARGDVVLFITDYTFLPSHSLLLHSTFHADGDANIGLMCPHQYYDVPPLKSIFPTYKQLQTEQYAEDVAAGVLNDAMWSVFKDPVSSVSSFEVLDSNGWASADPKLSYARGQIGSEFFHAKHESCRLNKVIEINGWDEDLDEGHGYQDSDLSARLARAGVAWTIEPTCVAQIVNPRPIFPFARRFRSCAENEQIWYAKRAAEYPRVNSWDLGTARKIMLGLPL